MNAKMIEVIEREDRDLILTSDIWDTVIRRRCHPEAIKLLVAKYIYFKYFASLSDQNKSIEKIYFERLAKERELASRTSKNGFDDEYLIEDVIESLVCSIFTSTDVDVNNIVSDIVGMEIKLESSLTYPDKEAVDFISKAKPKACHYISDFYMTSGMLNEILKNNDILKLFDGGLTSCEVKLNKRSSNLFPYFVEHNNIDINKMLHFGDNLHSDVTSPQNVGINAFHYYNNEQEKIREQNIALFQDKNEIFNRINNSEVVNGKELPSIGMKLAPFFISFVEHILEQAYTRRINKILFITREGEFFHKIFDIYYKKHSSLGIYDHHNINYDVLSVSRSSLINTLPFEIENYLGIWSQYSLRGVKKLLMDRGLDVKDVEKYLHKYDFIDNEIIENPEKDQRVINLFSDIELKDICLKALKPSRDAFTTYTDRVFNGVEDIILVDVGWFGSCQDLLQKHFPTINFIGEYIGLRQFEDEVTPQGEKNGFIFDHKSKSGNLEIERFAEVIEVLTSSNKGSVVSYESQDNIVNVVRDVDYRDEEFDSGIQDLQQGVFIGAEKYGELTFKSRLSINDLKVRGIEAFMQTCQNPSKSFASLYFNTLRHDVFREETYSNRNEVPSLIDLIKAVFIPREREKVIFFFRSTQWREGLKFSIENRSFIEQKLFSLLLKAASIFKKFKNK